MKRVLLLLVLLIPQSLSGQTLTVTLKKKLWADGHGIVQIGEKAITYEASKKDESRTWEYPDIQYFDRISTKEFVILTYEDRRLAFGQDRQFHFVVTEGELDDGLFHTITARLGKPVTDRVVPAQVAAEYSVPVKHLHTFGGCEGVLKFAADTVYYVTGHRQDAREWKLGRDVQSVWSADPYQLEIHAYDNNRREFSRTRVYNFQLKEALNQDFYRNLKLELYSLEASARGGR
ncbi:MAG TPA: hypothetical protein VM182_08210 [Terriglobia bacterium]|nr:hypothetical protein [Terriglobia bacterium]